jgi:two-component system, NtrC family, C4-dicarboxylate transport response regulator DctD
LRERREDIPALFARFVREALGQVGKQRFEMSAADRKRLVEHDWPGNVRELRSYAFAAVLNLPRPAGTVDLGAPRLGLSARMAQYERMIIAEALEATRGNVVRACARLQTPRKSLYEKLRRHGLDPATFRAAGKLRPENR